MKKQVLAVAAFAFGISSVFAQDLTSKKGEPILPEAEDWAISVDANPIFTYVGNAFNGNLNNGAPNTNFLTSDQTIIGKKFIDEKNAYRVMVRIGFVNSTFKNNVVDNSQTTAPTFPAQNAEVQDKFKMSNTNIMLGVGKEMRRGKTRLQGFYGADAMIWLGSSSQKYTYGNVITPVPSGPGQTSTPTSTQWDATNGSVLSESAVGSRTTKVKSGMTFGIGVRGFIGAEYFIFPKIAVGCEYGLGLGYQMTGKGKVTTEEQGGTPNQVAEIERVSAGNSRFGLDTDMNQGNMFGFRNAGSASLKVTFHF
jgi:hypothetical protein